MLLFAVFLSGLACKLHKVEAAAHPAKATSACAVASLKDLDRSSDMVAGSWLVGTLAVLTILLDPFEPETFAARRPNRVAASLPPSVWVTPQLFRPPPQFL